ncbi:sigma-70 family RNA polymerase sigma factor [Anaerovorax sp. IOR16]|uniref:sigma-70 family RNA polymerase sigma factor n=1 Tax=Anaerovorax sp. IOR16 TaxID=2773458 RepID=UPI0019D0C8E9|nr:sigma-70 family RNA polymerase sigma factor [Anaerovorax sp. IOR16]
MDKNEFAARIELLKKRLYRTAYLYLGNEASALEAVDEAVYKGLKALNQLRQPEYFDTWLTRILINECKKELKRLTRVHPMEYLPEEGNEEYNYDVLPLKEAIGKLPTDLRMVVILRYFSGFTLTQTAESLNIPQGTVVTRQRRALELLKLDLSEEEEAL